jgi:hypothetical protein
MKAILIGLATVFGLFAWGSDDVGQPSVSRRVLICDTWQWIGGGAVTWGCLTTPRAIFLSDGKTTDEIVVSLQNQINQLKAQVESLRQTQR